MPAPTRVTSQKNSNPADVLAKDDVELRLEKALFGDDAGFLESLKRNQVQEGRSLAKYEDNASEQSLEDEADGELDDVADEDVGTVRRLCSAD
jgi:hypothetical protein